MKRIFTLFITFWTLLGFYSCQQSSSNQSATFFPRAQKADHLDRFESEIQAYEMADRNNKPAKHSILFIGSSSIRMWQSLASDFEGIKVFNRGFGGSTIPEVHYYAERVIWNYEPSVIVFYCGENDINDGEHPALVFQNFKKFFADTEKKLPLTTFVFISAKPSPQRWKLWKEFQLFNNMVMQFAANRSNLHFLDISALMMNDQGQPDEGLFMEDQLHMNGKGYEKWTAELKPLLTEIIQKNAIK